ncbi:MAG: plasmid pRiA4b ORF-3 family protein [Firmicutes bacterium]|nr:plasmid pRiA4b ORF-3 family protein [Bacillota bacterium]
MDGASYRPPEGGVEGYKNFIEIIGNPSHPEHDSYLLRAEKTGVSEVCPSLFLHS